MTMMLDDVNRKFLTDDEVNSFGLDGSAASESEGECWVEARTRAF